MLNIHSKFSLRYGVKEIEWIVNWAIQSGYPKIALTDINSVSGVLSFIQCAQKKSLNIAVGVDIRNNNVQQYVILARNNRGFHELNTFLSQHLTQQQDFPSRPPYLPNCVIIYPYERTHPNLQSNELIGVSIREISQLKIQSIENYHQLVVLQSMTFEHKRDHNIHRLLRAIDENCILSKLTENQFAAPSNCFMNAEILQDKWIDFPEIIANTNQLLSNCTIHFDFGEQAIPQNISTYTGSIAGDKKLIKELSLRGIEKRYPKPTPKIIDRIKNEIEVIQKKGYLAYFLVTWDIVHFATSKGYFHVGRGSGANSIVAFLLGITDVDPLELDLYFERFINLYRKNPPDFDIDFSWTERDEVIQYIFERFENTALLCTYNTFQFRASIRELGKVFGLPKYEIDSLVVGKKLTGNLDEIGHLILKYSRYLEGLPSHLSIHAGGIIISHKPISWFSATFLPPKGFPTTQFSMLEAEDVGLYKFDILSQRGLTKITDALSLIQINQPNSSPKNIRDITYFKSDERIRNLLQNGNAMGCFYVESPAMRMLLKKLNVQTYLELVAASSIIRPGVSSSGMMREYILRHKDITRRNNAHPILRDIMPETYGVMVYQEDVIKVAHHFAGLTLDEADVLRRGMSGKYRSKKEFQFIQEKFKANCIAKQYPIQLIEEVWNQIESFAGYAFSKGHSASYAVESYQSLYLKAYYPLEYMVATINNFGGYYRTEIYIHEASRHGALIEAPEINHSNWESTIAKKTIYLGFNLINGMEHKTIQQIVSKRANIHLFKDFEHFLKEVKIPLEQLILLIRIGAFRRIADKKVLLWRAYQYFKKSKSNDTQIILFDSAVKQYQLPPLETHSFEQAFEELELLGFPLCSPFELIDEPLITNHVKAAELENFNNSEIWIYGYLISVKKTRTSKGERMEFGHFYDIAGKLFDTVHFPNIAQQFNFQGIGIYLLKGIVTEEFGYFTLEVLSMRKIKYISDVRYLSDNKKTAS